MGRKNKKRLFNFNTDKFNMRVLPPEGVIVLPDIHMPFYGSKKIKWHEVYESNDAALTASYAVHSLGFGKTRLMVDMETTSLEPCYGQRIDNPWERRILGEFKKIDYPLAGMDIGTRTELYSHIDILKELNIGNPGEYHAYQNKDNLKAIEPLLNDISNQALIALILCEAVDDSSCKNAQEFDSIVSPLVRKMSNKKLLRHVIKHAWGDLKKMGRTRHNQGVRHTTTDIVYGKCQARLETLSNNSIHFLLED